MAPSSKRLLFFLLVTLTSLGVETAAEFNLVILHVNDMDSRFEQTNHEGDNCSQVEADNNKCYGGFARIAHKVKEMKRLATEKEIPPVIFLTAGNTFAGTNWYFVHKWRIVSKLTNMLSIDAANLGFHEFDDGVDDLASFLNKSNYPVVVSNMDLSEEPKLQATPLRKSTVLMVEGKKIGIVGYILTDTKYWSQTGDVFFRHELQSVYQETAALKEQGVDIIIALGHADFETDLHVAREVPDVDVVVGGHSRTFLSTDKPEGKEEKSWNGSYPKVVTQVSGKRVLVVQAYKKTKYLGILNLTFDTGGEVISWQGNPVLLDHLIDQDVEVLKELDMWRKDVDNFKKQKVGVTRVNLVASCQLEECNLLNFVTDAILDFFVKNSQASGNRWTKASIVLLHGSAAMGKTFDAFMDNANKGVYTMDTLTTALPYNDKVVFLTLTGKNLLKALEWSVRAYPQTPGTAGEEEFLQVSGLRVNYDICKEPWERVTSVQVRCSHCMVPTYSPLDLDELYGVLLPVYLAAGGFKSTFLEDSLSYEVLQSTYRNAILDYFNTMSPVNPGLEGRITFSPKNCSEEAFISNRAPRNIMSFWPLLQGLVLVLLAS